MCKVQNVLKTISSENIQPVRSIVHKKMQLSKTSEEIESKKTDLEEKVAVVTGGASGIGFAIARQFMKEDMTALTIIDKDKERGNQRLNELAEEFGEEKVLFIEADVTDTEQIDLAFRNTVLHYDTIDIIVNNAGIMDDACWEQQLKTNLNGCVIGKSSSGDGGIIVNMGSIMSVIPSSGFPGK